VLGGIEQKGIKDHGKMNQFLDEVYRVDANTRKISTRKNKH